MTVTDEISGCTDTESATIESIDPIQIVFETSTPSCMANNSIITIFDVTTSANIGFQLFLDEEIGALSNPDFPVEFIVTEGIHEIIIVDDNGCRFEEEFEIVATSPAELIIDNQDAVTIGSGESTALNIETNFTIDSISWSPAIGLSLYLIHI